MLLRLFANMNVSVGTVWIACNYAMRKLEYSSRRAMIWICSGQSKIPAPAIFYFPPPSGGVNEPSV